MWLLLSDKHLKIVQVANDPRPGDVLPPVGNPNKKVDERAGPVGFLAPDASGPESVQDFSGQRLEFRGRTKGHLFPASGPDGLDKLGNLQIQHFRARLVRSVAWGLSAECLRVIEQSGSTNSWKRGVKGVDGPFRPRWNSPMLLIKEKRKLMVD
jgi:hypothetical protein